MPGSVVSAIAAQPVSGQSIDTGTAFIIPPSGFEKGPLTPQLITSIPQAQTLYGADTSTSNGATYLEAYFRIGGKRAWVNRVAGPAALAAAITLNGSGATASVKFTALSVGTWGNALRLAVIAGTGSNIKLVLSATSGTLLTAPITSGDLADKTAVLAYTGFSAYGAFTSAGAGTIPVVVAAVTPAIVGTDDNASITDAIRTTAFAAFAASMGPGQELMPGDTRAAAATLVGASARAHGRVALWGCPDDSSAANGTAAALALRTDVSAASLIACEPWTTGPPLVAGGVARDIPPSIVMAAVLANRDALSGNPNEPAAGDNGAIPWILGVKYNRTPAELDTLTNAGVNVLYDRYGDGNPVIFGNRTLTDPSSNTLYLLASNVRLDMFVRFRAQLIADRFVFRQVDGKGQLAARLNGQLTAMLSGMPTGALYALVDSVTAEQIDPGYIVDTSTGAAPAVNTPTTIAAGQLHARIGLRRSPAAEWVYIDVAIYPTTQEF
jgi:hypothetical protein